MGWNWDHTSTIGSRSYTAHDELGQEIRSRASRQDWAAVAPLFGQGTGDPFDVQPAQASRMAEAFTALAPLVSPVWTSAVRDLAACARAAHRAGAVWHWY